jgi:hypothetical protein
MSDLSEKLTDTEHYLGVSKVREKLSVSIQLTQKTDMEISISRSQTMWTIK